MLKDALVIFRKEMKNVFKDKRSVFALFVLPLILMPAIFFTMGQVTGMQISDRQETVYPIEIVNSPGSDFEDLLSDYLLYRKVILNPNSEYEIYPLTLRFPAGFEPGDQATVEVEYNSTSSKSTYAFEQLEEALIDYSRSLGQEFLVERGIDPEILSTITVTEVDTAPEESQGTEFLSMMIPYLLLIYIFAGSMNIGLDTTAGEKERGSLASLLVNQVSRSSIALGKVFYVIASALISSFSSFAGLIIAFTLTGGGLSFLGVNTSGIMNAGSLLALLLTLISMSALAASLIVCLGCLARNMKEGSGYIMPIYILAIVIGVATMQMDASSEFTLFFIPLINAVFMLKAIIISAYTPVQLLITLGVNIAVCSVFVRLTAMQFNSERILSTTE